jgi:hypothetical protein
MWRCRPEFWPRLKVALTSLRDHQKFLEIQKILTESHPFLLEPQYTSEQLSEWVYPNPLSHRHRDGNLCLLRFSHDLANVLAPKNLVKCP